MLELDYKLVNFNANTAAMRILIFFMQILMTIDVCRACRRSAVQRYVILLRDSIVTAPTVCEA